MTDQFMGYTVHRATVFHPNTILFSRDNETITVSMIQEALSHIADEIAKKNPIFKQYGVALKVFRAIQVRLTNRPSRKPNKEDLKTACEVLEEIEKEHATNQMQRDNIETAASWCKLFIECFIRD